MTPEAKTILTVLEEYLTKYPDIRFGQALVNLNIVQVTKPEDPLLFSRLDFIPRVQDPYYNTDKDILNRIKLP